ncbi:MULTISPECIES: DUF3168 domain-containing protein [Paracoccus]|uniref:DUF3168 domain-containing protein n=1 Tax=Paracoccus TaxID=265 RepID=UPI001FB7F9B4|nr:MULTISPECIES: DUF3168 domain-containing protein [Paracoccus]MCJ1900953.1 DUF3168 domain-containing protein [Paracoccus versutus]MDF3906148.1 DUF3168 domain-containing protein [Paracoccus sp. AS002]
MIEPGLALQAAVGNALATAPGVAAHVAPERIRAGMIRPEHMPAILLGAGNVEVLGRASGGKIVAEVRMMLHLWAVDDGSDVAQEVAGAMLMALMDAPPGDGFWFDGWDRPALAWIPDPDPAQSHSHAAISLRAVIRWRAD